MKARALLLIATLTLTAGSACAQTLETTTEYPTGYVKLDRATWKALKVEDGAVYVGNWLIKVEATASKHDFYIPNWVTRICDGAFSESNIEKLYFPASWTESAVRQPAIFISPKAFADSKIEYFDTYNDGSATSVSSAKANTERKETARYDASGKPIESPTQGLNIIKYNDGTASKVMK